MQTALQNTEVEKSLIKQIDAEDQTATTFNPLEGDLVEEDEASEDAAEEEPSEEEEVKLPEGDLEEDTADEEEPETEGEKEEVVEEGLSSTLKKATENIPAGRDYSKYSEEDAKFLKQMSNEAFEHFSKRSEEFATIVKQLDEKKTSKPAIDHPDAYVLSDEYKENYANFTKAQQEQQHWRDQLIKIRNGDSWQNIEGYDKGDRLVLSKDAFKPTQQAEIDVEMALQEAVGLNRKYTEGLDALSKTYKDNYSDAVTTLEREQNANFAWLTDDKVAQEKIVLPNVGTTTVQTIKDSFTEALPKTFRSHPMAELASNLFVTLQLQAAYSSSENAKAKEAKRKEPKARRKSSSTSSDAGDDLSVPDWMDL